MAVGGIACKGIERVETEAVRMRITFILPYASAAGGVKVVAIYADRLRRRGHEVTVISQPDPDWSLWRRVKTYLATGRWRRRRVRSPHFDGLDVVHRILDARRPVQDADVPDGDVVIATWWETAFAVAALSGTKGAKAYFVQGHEIHEHQPRHLVHGSYLLPLRKIVVSSWLRAIMQERYGNRDAILVPNGVDTGQFNAPPRGRQASPTVGFIYSTKPVKGLPVILEAIEIARRSLPDLRVVAFGTPPLSPGNPLPQGAAYFRDPPQAEIREIYAKCDVWLCGSHAEGFGLPILEAMACGCPVVSTRVGAAIDFIEEGVCGHVTPPGDPQALAGGLLKVLGLSEADWRSMSQAARSHVRGYGWDAAAEKFERALVKLVADHRVEASAAGS